MMKLKIIATGSTKFERFIKRWGVSFLIGEDVIFDTFGAPLVFMKNIKKFNIDTSKIKHIVLSHDDWDHISGLWHFIKGKTGLTVYICPGFKKGIKDRLMSTGVKVIEADKKMRITDSVYSTGELFGKSDGREIYEQSIVVETSNGVSVICGCAHPGLEKIIGTVSRQFGKNIYFLAGGLHLKDSNNEEIKNEINILQKHGVKKVAPMHCTGRRAEELMRSSFGGGYHHTKEGDVIEI